GQDRDRTGLRWGGTRDLALRVVEQGAAQDRPIGAAEHHDACIEDVGHDGGDLMDASAPLLEQLGRRRIAARSSRAPGTEAEIDGGDVRALRRRAVEYAAPMRGLDQSDRVMGGGGGLFGAAGEDLEEPPGLAGVAGLAAHWAAAYRHPESCADTEVHED